MPIGLIATSWGGVAIQVWMSPASLAKCGAAAAPPPDLRTRLRAGSVPGASRTEQAMAVWAAAQLAGRPSDAAQPTSPSVLYYSMLYPLLSNPVSALFWYQVSVL